MPAATGVSLSEGAARKIRALLEAEGKSPAEHGLRVAIKGGGCSGFMYVFDLDRPRADDAVFGREDAKLIVDPKSLMFLRGAEVDYFESLMSSGFRVHNPNEKSRCGCGHSFSA